MPIGEFKRYIRHFLPDPLYQFRFKGLPEIQAILGEAEPEERLLLVLSTAWDSSNSLRKVVVNGQEWQSDWYFLVTSHRVVLARRAYESGGVIGFLGFSRFKGWERYNRLFPLVASRFSGEAGGLVLMEPEIEILVVGKRVEEQKALTLVASFVSSRGGRG
jgi:hypothetical protein